MIAAETKPIALATRPTPTTESLVGRLGVLLTRLAAAGATDDDASDEAVWTSVARGF